MPLLRSRKRSLHAAGAAACHKNLLFKPGCLAEEGFLLAAYLRIYRAVEHAVDGAVGEAVEASQARTDFIPFSGSRLDGQIRIRQGLPGQADDVSLAGSDDFLEHFRVGIGAYRGHRRGNVLFDFRRKPQVVAVGHEHGGGGMHAGDVDFMVAGGYMDDIHLAVQHLRDGQALVLVIAPGQEFGGAHPEFDGHPVPYSLSDGLDNRQGEAHPVFHAAAPLVGPLVVRGG